MMRIFGFVFRPMVNVLNRMAFGLMRLLRIPEPDRRQSLYTSAELAIVTDETADSGKLGEMQRDLIRNILNLDERSAEELMTSRSRVEALDVSATAEEITARIVASPRSRYPVVDGGLDAVVGILHIKDYIRANRRGVPFDLKRLIRPLPTVAAAATAEHLLQRFKRDRNHASVVVDEFGSTLGLVTLDDIIAEVMDDRDTAESARVVRHSDGSLSLDGETTLAELRQDHQIDLAHPDVTTLAGLILAQHGTVPGAGATVRFQDYELTVEELQGRKITRVRVRVPTVSNGERSPERA
jgi:CBS domain containing-hemolysin-like protein